MDQIWFNSRNTIEELNNLNKGTLGEVLDIRFIKIGPAYLKAVMPVDARTHQPYGLLHGGASAALAETIGSVASSMCIDVEKIICVGIEIYCNHLRGKRTGLVTATAQPLHLGESTHVWDIRIEDEGGHLICASRLTMAILRKKAQR